MRYTYRYVSKALPHELNVKDPVNGVVKLKKCSGAGWPTTEVLPPAVVPFTVSPQLIDPWITAFTGHVICSRYRPVDELNPSMTLQAATQHQYLGKL